MKLTKILFIIGSLMILTSCAKFNGSGSGNEDHFNLSYSILNESQAQEISLKKGNTFSGPINNSKGKITVKISNKNKDVLLEKEINTGKATISFTAPEDGDYTCTVIGQHAKGDFNFVRQ